MSMLDEFDFHKVCRTCLSAENLKSLYSEYVTQSYFNEILLICTSVECFEKDDLSVLICTNCIWELNRSYKFALKCKESVRKFKSFPDKYTIHVRDSDQTNEISLKDPLESTVLQKEINHELVLIKNEIDEIKIEPETTIVDSTHEVTTIKPFPDGIKVETIIGETLDEPNISKSPTEIESCDSEDTEAHGEKPYSCTTGDNKNSVPIRTEDNRFLCTICRNTFAKERELKNHVWLHGGEKPYPCSICTSSFTRMTRLNVHMKRHKNAKQFSCPLCNQQFIKLFFLKSHMRTHAGVKPYPCPLCDLSFDQSTALSQHNLEAHSGEQYFDFHTHGVKPYACTICEDSFSLPQHLIVHIQQHSRPKKPYTCVICNNSFAKAYCLTRHMQTHTGEKPYSCTLCDKSFNRKLYLSNHMSSRHKDIHCETEDV